MGQLLGSGWQGGWKGRCGRVRIYLPEFGELVGIVLVLAHFFYAWRGVAAVVGAAGWVWGAHLVLHWEGEEFSALGKHGQHD